MNSIVFVMMTICTQSPNVVNTDVAVFQNANTCLKEIEKAEAQLQPKCEQLKIVCKERQIQKGESK